jgi:plastocyanin
MRALLLLAAATLLAGTNQVFAQAVDPDVRGPLRRGAGAAAETLGAPGVENRIERRQARRDADAWRMRYYNNEWWYYSPQNRWMYYRDNRWTPFDVGSFQALRPRYTTGYRGAYTGRYDRMDRTDRYASGRDGAPTLTVSIHDGQFDPQTLNVAPGTTIRWINRGAETHTVTATNETWDSGELSPDESYQARFKKPGTYEYVCELHPKMRGTIVVGETASVPGAAIDADREGVKVDVQPGGRVDVDANRPGGADVDVQAPRPAPQPAPAPGNPPPQPQ